jgi:conjugal transfer pilus assembly protein TraV
LYAPPQELRIWVNRWRDKDGDLHDDSFMYVLVGEGQWLVRD